MIFKWETIRFDRENIPPYIFKFNVALVVYFAAAFAAFIAAAIPIGLCLGDFAEMIFCLCFVAAFIAGTAAFYIVALRLRERLVAERAAELEKKFYDMPIEEAEKILTERGVIKENNFVCTHGDIFGEKPVPFGKAEVYVYESACDIILKGHAVKTVTHPLKIEIYADIYDGVDVSEPCARYKLDCALFNFLDKRNLVNYEDNRGFYYLKTDKKNFVRKAFGFKLK